MQRVGGHVILTAAEFADLTGQVDDMRHQLAEARALLAAARPLTEETRQKEGSGLPDPGGLT